MKTISPDTIKTFDALNQAEQGGGNVKISLAGGAMTSREIDASPELITSLKRGVVDAAFGSEVMRSDRGVLLTEQNLSDYGIKTSELSGAGVEQHQDGDVRGYWGHEVLPVLAQRSEYRDVRA